MKESVSKYLIISLSLHFLVVIFFFYKTPDFKKSKTSILIVDLITDPESDRDNKNFDITKSKTNKKQIKHSNLDANKASKTFENKLDNKHVLHNQKLYRKKFDNPENNQETIKRVWGNLDSNKNISNDVPENQEIKFFTKAKYKIGSIKNPHPPYPLIARKRGWQGKIILNVLVNQNGYVEKINIERSSGFEILDKVSLNTIKKWQFIPAKYKDKNVTDKLNIPVKFVLSELK